MIHSFNGPIIWVSCAAFKLYMGAFQRCLSINPAQVFFKMGLKIQCLQTLLCCDSLTFITRKFARSVTFLTS